MNDSVIIMTYTHFSFGALDTSSCMKNIVFSVTMYSPSRHNGNVPWHSANILGHNESVR